MVVVLPAGFALEEIKPFPDQRQELFAVHLQVMRHDHGFVNFRRQQFLADLFVERGIAFLQETALARNRLDDALAFQFGVGLGDGVAIDAQFLGQRADGRQRFAGTQRAGGRRVADLVHQLQVNRLAGLEINLKYHGRLLLSYNSMTVGGRRQEDFSTGLAGGFVVRNSSLTTKRAREKEITR